MGLAVSQTESMLKGSPGRGSLSRPMYVTLATLERVRALLSTRRSLVAGQMRLSL